MSKEHIRHCAAAFLLDTAVTTGVTAMPFFIYYQLDGGAQMSGTLGALQSACYAAACLVSSPFVSRAKNGMVWAVAGCIWFMVVLPLAPLVHNLYWFGPLAILSMGGMSLIWPALQSWVGAEPDVTLRGKRMAVYNLSWSGGLAFGPLLGGPLYDIHYMLPFGMVFLLTAAAMALLLTLPHEKKQFRVADQGQLDARAEYDRKSEVYLYSAWLANFVAFAYIGIMRSVFPDRVKDLVEHGNLTLLGAASPINWPTATSFSFLAFMMSFVSAVLFFVLGYVRWWHHKFWLQLLAQVAAAAAFWILGSTHSLVMMLVCAGVVGINCGICFIASQQYSISNPRLKHQRASIHEGIIGMGGFLGALVFGYLAGHFGVAWPFLNTPFIIAPLLVCQGLLLAYARVSRRSPAKV